MIIRHDRSDVDCLVDENEWLGVVTFFEGDGVGTLIMPTWILTAAHTANNIPPGHILLIAERSYRIAQVIPHPEYGRQVSSVDLALVELATPVLGIRPFGLYPSADEQGQEALLLGRGDFGNGIDGVQGVDHRLRRATNQIAG